MLDVAHPDDCCGEALATALLNGELSDKQTWTHEECGCEWRARIVGAVRLWEPYELIEVIRRVHG